MLNFAKLPEFAGQDRLLHILDLIDMVSSSVFLQKSVHLWLVHALNLTKKLVSPLLLMNCIHFDTLTFHNRQSTGGTNNTRASTLQQSLQWNAAISNVIRYTCVWQVKTYAVKKVGAAFPFKVLPVVEKVFRSFT